ncbi:19161_t:CDS:2, partial [Funneliformis geosporum]
PEEKIEKLLNEIGKNINLEIDDLEKNSNLLSYAKKYARNKEKLTLLYHYRSRYPELIDFSNQAFYNGILQIVSAKARYIVNLLKTLPADKEIGIITFNKKQQEKIEDYIEERNRYKNLFVKNLEEVQGDERDIIIFSTGYARNEEGKLYLYFGPLGQEGGEKRLNVAISRAREKIIIVTSLLPKPERIQAILKKLPAIANASLYEKDLEPKSFDSLFEEQVYNELVKKLEGYEIHKQIKSVGYHIDLAV